MSDKKSILFPLMEAGAGHKVPAQAIIDAIERRAPGRYDMRTVDLAAACGALRDDAFIKGAWNFALRHPFWGGAGYIAEDLLWPLSMVYLPVMHRRFYRDGMAWIRDRKPDFVLSTHYFTSMIAAAARKRLGADYRLASFSTDPFAGHGWWREKGADVVIVGSELAKSHMTRAGFPADKVKVLPFPVGDKFFSPPAIDRAAFCREHDLDPALPIVLVASGGQGISRNTAFTERAWSDGIPANFLVICGRNGKIRARIEAKANSGPRPGRLRALGYVDNVHELLAACDLTISKPSPSSMFEALVVGRPIVFTSYVTGQEYANLAWSRDRGLSLYLPRYAGFKKALARLVGSPEALGELRAKVEAAKVADYLRGAADAIAEYVLEFFERA